MSEFYDFLWNDFPIKYLEFDVDLWEDNGCKCPAMEFLRNIIPKKSDTLIQLSLEEVPLSHLMVGNGRISYPKLKRVRLSPALVLVTASDCLPKDLLAQLIDASPNIEDLTAEDAELYQFSFLTPEKFKILKSLLFRSWKCAWFFY